MGYLDLLALQTSASLVLTDSGGIQEETTYLGVPCLTVRPNTERPITITHGTNRLIPGTRDAIVENVREAFSRDCGLKSDSRAPELWDGHAAERIVDVMLCT